MKNKLNFLKQNFVLCYVGRTKWAKQKIFQQWFDMVSFCRIAFIMGHKV